MYFYLILFIALFARLFLFSIVPDGINCDEAFAGYEAYSVFISSFDSWGKKLPLYFITGGGGTNVLYSYITTIFLLFFELDVWVIRLPQVILNIISILCFYKLIEIIYNKKIALIGLFVISIMPWHIISSRWGFHGNIAPLIYLFAFLFFCKSYKNIKFIWLSMLFFGLGCYTYDPIIGFILGSVFTLVLYLIFYTPIKNKCFWLNLILSGIFFILLITPIILLYLINNNYINEINTDYFSIPKLPGWRGKEINTSQLLTNSFILLKLLITQTDNMIWNTINQFGLFYHISSPFILLGLYSTTKQGIIELKNKQFSYKTCILVVFLWGIIYSTLFPAYSSNRVNYLFFFICIFITSGISVFLNKTNIIKCIFIVFIIHFTFFEIFYFTKYNELAKNNFSTGFKDALKEANKHHKLTGQNIHILQENSEPTKVLFYNKIDNITYKNTVVWKNYPSSYLFIDSFLHYKFLSAYDDFSIKEGIIYIAPLYTRSHFINTLKNKVNIKVFNKYITVTSE